MKNKAIRIFQRMQRKGLTRAIAQIGPREFYYPPIDCRKKRITGKIFWLIMVLVIVAYIFWTRTGKSTKTPLNDEFGMTVLHQAIINSNVDEVTRLLEEKMDIDFDDNYGWTGLHWAVFCQEDKICRILLDHKAKPDLPSQKTWFKYEAGITPRQMAKMTGNQKIIKLFNE